MLAITAAFEREVKDYLKAGSFTRVRKERGQAAGPGAIRFYLSSAVRDVVVVVGGFGREASGEAVRLVVEKYTPDLLVSAGFAGGAQPGLNPGEVFVCKRLLGLTGHAAYWSSNTVMEKSVRESALPYDQWNDIEIRWGSCLTVPSLVPGSFMKEWLGRTFATDVIDMESYWVSEAAENLKVPHLILRAVFDPMELTLPPFVAPSLGESTVRTALRAASYLIAHPGSVKAATVLMAQAKQATASLSRFLLNLTPTGTRVLDLAAGAR